MTRGSPLAVAAQIVVVWMHGAGFQSCAYLYSVDNPAGFDQPVYVCGCQYPAYEVRSINFEPGRVVPVDALAGLN